MTTWSCPYWHKDKGDRVTCEAGSIRFPDHACKMDYIHQFCAGDWDRCQLSRMMTTYYDRQELPYDTNGGP